MTNCTTNLTNAEAIEDVEQVDSEMHEVDCETGDLLDIDYGDRLSECLTQRLRSRVPVFAVETSSDLGEYREAYVERPVIRGVALVDEVSVSLVESDAEARGLQGSLAQQVVGGVSVLELGYRYLDESFDYTVRLDGRLLASRLTLCEAQVLFHLLDVQRIEDARFWYGAVKRFLSGVLADLALDDRESFLDDDHDELQDVIRVLCMRAEDARN